MKVAILGANGFIGSRAVEMLHLGGVAEVRPIVRGFASLARVSRFDLDCRIADAADRSALRAACTGCDIVVHAATGEARTIPAAAAAVYRAADDASVRRLVYLSTAAVHGQDPQPGVDESTPLSDRQPLPYNNAKVRAEWTLERLRERGTVEVVVLRPGIVYGPRSQWTGGLADALLQGTGYLVDGGTGVSNSVYVDNLVHAIWLAFTTPAADGQAFLIGDREMTTWADFYRPIVIALGLDFARIPRVPPPAPRGRQRSRPRANSASRPPEWILSVMPRKWKQALLRALGQKTRPLSTSPWAVSAESAPVPTLEMALLHRCGYKFPFDKATRILGYDPPISFPEACRRSIAWLAFAGYPVRDRDDPPPEAV